METCIVFDLDGTLVDSRLDLARSVNRTLAALGHPTRPIDEIVGHVGHGAPHLLSRCLPPGARDDASVCVATAAFRADYAEHIAESTVPYAGVEGALATLASRAPLAVLTNKPGDLARLLLETLGLLDRFATVLGPDDAGAKKPDPRGLLAAVTRCGGRPGASWYVGDMVLDVRTARGAGVRAAAVSWGLGAAGALTKAGPDRLLASPGELLTLLGEA